MQRADQHAPVIVARRSPEAHLVTLCVREPDAAPSDSLRSAAAAVSDWQGLVATSARHCVSAFVQQAATRSGIRLPDSADRALRETALASLAGVMGLDQELKCLTATFNAAHLPLIVLKGPVLARTVYKTVALRPYGDLDLAVDAAHQDAAAAMLIGCGWIETIHGAEEARRQHAGHMHGGAAFHRVFVSAKTQAVVELHADPLQLGIAPTCEAGRWQRAVPVPDLPGALMLSPEDQLVQLSVHVHKHGFLRLIWLKDLDLILRAYEGCLDWDAVESIARLEGVRASTWYSLQLAQELLSAPVPRCELNRLRPAVFIRALYRCIWPISRIANLDGHMRRRAVQFHAADSWRGMLPSLVLMGRRPARARAIMSFVLRRWHA